MEAELFASNLPDTRGTRDLCGGYVTLLDYAAYEPQISNNNVGDACHDTFPGELL